MADCAKVAIISSLEPSSEQAKATIDNCLRVAEEETAISVGVYKKHSVPCQWAKAFLPLTSYSDLRLCHCNDASSPSWQ